MLASEKDNFWTVFVDHFFTVVTAEAAGSSRARMSAPFHLAPNAVSTGPARTSAGSCAAALSWHPASGLSWLASAWFLGSALTALVTAFRIHHLELRRLAWLGLLMMAVADGISISAASNVVVTTPT